MILNQGIAAEPPSTCCSRDAAQIGVTARGGTEEGRGRGRWLRAEALAGFAASDRVLARRQGEPCQGER